MARFKDKVVIVTGAGSGIGAATARYFFGTPSCLAALPCHKKVPETMFVRGEGW